MKKLFTSSFVLLTLAACSAEAPTTSTTMPIPAPDADSSTVDEMIVEEEGPATEPMSSSVTVSAVDWEFQPANITFTQGSNAQIQLQGLEGHHGLAVPGLGINQSIEEGQDVTIQIPTDVPGTYEFYCNVPCGPGHREMRGTITIE